MGRPLKCCPLVSESDIAAFQVVPGGFRSNNAVGTLEFAALDLGLSVAHATPALPEDLKTIWTICQN